jgi:hypothetical protein
MKIVDQFDLGDKLKITTTNNYCFSGEVLSKGSNDPVFMWEGWVELAVYDWQSEKNVNVTINVEQIVSYIIESDEILKEKENSDDE